MANNSDNPSKRPDSNADLSQGPNKRTESDSAIDLTAPAEGDISGISQFEWASLVEDSQVPSGASQAKFDAPSDSDLLAHADEMATAASRVVPPSVGSPGEKELADLLAEGDALFEAGAGKTSPPSSEFVATPHLDAAIAPPPGPPEEDDAIFKELMEAGIDLGHPNQAPELPPANEGESAIDLGASGFAIPSAPPGGHEDDVIDLGADALIGGERLANDPISEAVIDLDDSALVEDIPAHATEDEEAIELGADALVGSSTGLEEDEAIELGEEAILEEAFEPHGESGIDLGAPAGSGRSSGKHDSAVNFMDDFALEQPGQSATPGGSSRDLIAEGLESGVDLLGTSKSKLPTDEGVEDIIDDLFHAQVDAADPSSSVDLGSLHSLDVFDGGDENAPVGSSGGIGGARAADLDPEEEPTPVRKKHPSRQPASSDDFDLDHIEPVAQDVPLETKKGGSKKKPVESEHELQEVSSDEIGLDEGDSEKKPDRKKSSDKPRGRAGAMVGSGLTGALLATAACAGVWYAGLLPETTTPAPRPPMGSSGMGAPGVPGVQPAMPAMAGFDRTLEKIQAGHLDKVTPDELEKIEDAKPDQLVARAEFHWLSYLRDERGKNPRALLKPDADPVKKALADLEKAIATPDALFLRGQIHEMTGQADKARKDYAEGVAKFASDPAQKERFETALENMKLSPLGVGRLQPLPAAPPHLLALMLVVLQDPTGKQDDPAKPVPPPMPGTPGPTTQGGAPTPAAAPALPPEAGHAFWQALRQARASNFAEAVKSLDAARSRHDTRRYLLPRKQQNAASDPREEIFLRSCDELKGYWELLAKLKEKGYLEGGDTKNIASRIDEVLMKASEGARTAVVKDLGAKLFKDKPVASADDLAKLLAEERQATTTRYDGLAKTSAEQTKTIADLGTKLQASTTALTKTGETLKATQTTLAQSQEENNAGLATLRDISTLVASDFADLKTSRTSLLRDVKETARLAKVADPQGKLRELERELASDRAKLAQTWTPTQMVGYWVPLLDQNRERKDIVAGARADAARVLADPKARDEARGLALLVQGLALRNEDKPAEAKPVLEKARESLEDTSNDALARLESALSEVKDPAGAYARKARALEAQGKRTEALAVLERGLKAVPARKGPLHLERCRIGYESVRSRGAVAASDPVIVGARQDAQAAAAEGMADGNFYLGRIAEDVGQLDEAEKNYRSAMQAHAGMDEAGSRYRIALARVLLKRGAAANVLPAPRSMPPADRTGKLSPAGNVRRLGSLDMMSLMLALTLNAQGLPGEKVVSPEADKLADEILAMGDKAPFDARAQALAIKGLHTRAVNTYLAGLREKGLLAPEYANTLQSLVNDHPALRRPDTRRTPDPLLGEKHYAAGLDFFFTCNFASAEREFLSAVENDNGDARYYYFLGLSRLAQGKRDVNEDFDQGARLEDQGRPGRAAVSAALERVQGPWRQMLNDVRSRPIRERGK